MVQRYEISSDFSLVLLNYWILFTCFCFQALYSTDFCTFAQKLKYVMPRKTDGIEFENHPRLWKVRESRRWLYFPKKDKAKE